MLVPLESEFRWILGCQSSERSIPYTQQSAALSKNDLHMGSKSDSLDMVVHAFSTNIQETEAGFLCLRPASSVY